VGGPVGRIGGQPDLGAGQQSRHLGGGDCTGDSGADGLAVVAADIPGVADVVEPGAAVLVPPGDATALAEAVAALAADPGERARLGRAGRALALSRHTWDHRAASVLALAAEARYRVPSR
jgi:glycosyltransferase involved in cell wall biosynthesis